MAALSNASQNAIVRLVNLIGQCEELEWVPEGIARGPLGATHPTGGYRTSSPVLNARIEQAIRDIAPASVFAAKLEKTYDTEKFENLARALLADLKDGYVKPGEFAHAEVFTDFLDMAQELLDNGYRVASAVVAGSSAESHLRQLAPKHGVALIDDKGKPKNGGAINDDLAKSGAYDVTTQKQITFWQGVRNDAAHGVKDNNALDTAQIQVMITGIQSFMVNHSA